MVPADASSKNAQLLKAESGRCVSKQLDWKGSVPAAAGQRWKSFLFRPINESVFVENYIDNLLSANAIRWQQTATMQHFTRPCER